jgi:hypothetical protein
LWETTTTRPGESANSNRTCANGDLADFLGTNDMCQTPRVVSTSEGYTFDADCNSDGDHETFHADIRGDLQSHFTVDVTSSTTGAPHPDTLHSLNRYIGACQTGN